MSAELLAPPVFRPQLTTWDRPVPDDWLLPSVGDVAVARRESHIFIPPGHEILRQTAQPVDEALVASGGLERITHRLGEAAVVGRQRTLVGIAAPQIGEPYRIIGVNLTPGEGDQLTWLYNPEVIDHSEELYLDGESCFSCYKVNSGFVPRYVSVTIAAANLDKPLTFTDTPGQRHGIVSRIMQHEIDHLNGLRFPDRLSEYIDAGRLCEHVMAWAYTEHSSGYKDQPRRSAAAAFPPAGKSPHLHHAQMRRTGQTRQPWQPTLPQNQWAAIKFGIISLPIKEGVSV